MDNDEKTFIIISIIIFLVGMVYVVIWLPQRDRKAEEFYKSCVQFTNGDIHCPGN